MSGPIIVGFRPWQFLHSIKQQWAMLRATLKSLIESNNYPGVRDNYLGGLQENTYSDRTSPESLSKSLRGPLTIAVNKHCLSRVM